ncbi:PREDICTED: uncharacterized protein LOC109586789 [Amphimedon queenslandica]|uniref:Uncharacterized protein n=1 Tax=Amphimedon queenslandica TaxID=400682 RepID=A0A1X7TP95_AMPQE|nr:PREDICTED: uncharacterized protein LOC109586789 [Amphimedon queenslandica]|eukprot:XP_019858555.1 PREDICTED: uncharacterized protein LOC109586789 [Amphimedon queenslandica]
MELLGSLAAILIILFSFHAGTHAFPTYRCPSGLPDDKGKISLIATSTETGYSVKWVTHDTYYVDYLNLETICYPQETKPTGKTTVFVELSEVKFGVKNFTVDDTKDTLECRIFGCYIDSEWADIHAIEPVIIRIERGSPSPTSSIIASPSPSPFSPFPSPSSSLATITTCSTITTTISTLQNSPISSEAPKVVYSLTKRSSTGQNAGTEGNDTNNTFKDHFDIVVVILCLVVVFALLILSGIIVVLILEIRKMKQTKISPRELS